VAATAKPQPEKSPVDAAARRRGLIAALLGWLVPGAGQIYLRRFGRGALMALCVAGMLITGLSISGSLYWLFEPVLIFKLGAIGELGLGPLYFILRLAGMGVDAAAPLPPLSVSITNGYGSIFLISAGLMNYIAAMDAYDLAIGRRQ
jgi:TM2 domain-containing membrane protein YozV